MSGMIWSAGIHRVIWKYIDYDSRDWKGDTYKPECHPDLDPDILRKQEKEYEYELEHYGVVLLMLQKWNPEVGQGWEREDSTMSEYLHREETSDEFFPKDEYFNDGPERGGA